MDVFIFILCMILAVNFPIRLFFRKPQETFSLEKSHQFNYYQGNYLQINCFVNEKSERKYFINNYSEDAYRVELKVEDMKSITIEFRKIIIDIKDNKYKNNLFYELLYISYHTIGGDLPPRKIRFFDKYELSPVRKNINSNKSDPLFLICVRRSRKRYYVTASFRFSLDAYYGGDMELTELTRLLEGFLHVFGNDFAED